MRPIGWVLWLALGIAGCGGGGSGSDDGGNDGNGDPNSAPTIYVRDTGDDTFDGLTPATAVRSITHAISLISAGGTIIVGSGTYAEQNIDAPRGSERRPVRLIADASGRMTGDPPGKVIVESAGLSAFQVSAGTYLTIDGFTITGASGTNAAGIILRSGSDNATVRNCEIFDNQGDGIRVQSSANVLLFNNLIYGNSRNGIRISGNPGSPGARIINNTVASNGDRGIFIGSDEAASPGAFLRNNIIQDNGRSNLQVSTGPPSSVDGYDGDHNLVSPPSYRPDNLPREHDVNRDARFLNPGAGNYRLAQRTAGGTQNSLALNAGAPDTPPDLRDFLLTRTTAANNAADIDPVDLGYHYPR